MPEQPEPPPEPGSGPSREGDVAWNALSYLITGIFGFGALGWVLDRWWGTSFLAPAGALFGMGLTLYYVWFRYGSR